MKIQSIILAGGTGQRFGEDIPKQFIPLYGKPIIKYSLEKFPNPIVVIHKDWVEYFTKNFPNYQYIIGGETRGESVKYGLEICNNPDIILIHDAARPYVSSHLINKIITKINDVSMRDIYGVIPALKISGTVKKIVNDEVKTTINRDELIIAQTPQAFDFKTIYAAYKNSPHNNFTDDAALLEHFNHKIQWVDGEMENIKITYKNDIKKQNFIGIGFDVHNFEDGNFIILAGIRIPHNQTLKGHSDADVAIHALTDAIFSAINAGDIGEHFSPSEDKWKNANSEIFLKYAMDLLHKKNGKIINANIIIICESPKITPYKNEMKKNIAKILNISPDFINISATTTEKLGFIGRNEGIAAQASTNIIM